MIGARSHGIGKLANREISRSHLITRLRTLWYVVAGEMGTSRAICTLHRAIYRASGGRLMARALGCPVVLVTTTGRRSGRPHTVPVFGFPEGSGVVLVASNAGKDRHPAWFLNLQANPEADVQVGRERRRVRARAATAAERERLWPRLVGRYHGYEIYRQRTERSIPIVILEPA
jgi:deazaflavin-dependent oxidoreductase (nitroreductase family)